MHGAASARAPPDIAVPFILCRKSPAFTPASTSESAPNEESEESDRDPPSDASIR